MEKNNSTDNVLTSIIIIFKYVAVHGLKEIVRE